MQFWFSLIFAAACVAGQTALARPPLPLGPGDRPVYIKIDHQEYPVPAGMTPDSYYTQMVGGIRTGPSTTRQYPDRSFVSFAQPARQPITVSNAPLASAPLASYHVGFAPAAPRPPTYQAPRPAYYPRPAPSYPQPSQMWFPPSLNHYGQRQWVKLAEGTQPIEVPYGADPQQFLAGLRQSRLRNLSEGEKKIKKKKYVVQPTKKEPPPPVKKAPPPPPVKKAPAATLKQHVPHQKMPIPSIFKAHIPTPSFKKSAMYQVVPPTKLQHHIQYKGRPMYVAAKPLV